MKERPCWDEEEGSRQLQVAALSPAIASFPLAERAKEHGPSYPPCFPSSLCYEP
jgi:hypothetical protein